MTDIKFAAIGINHSHIYGQVDCLTEAGAQFVAFHAIEDDLAADFGARYPQARRVTSADSRRSLELVTAVYHSSSSGEDVPPPGSALPNSLTRDCSENRVALSRSRSGEIHDHQHSAPADRQGLWRP